MAPTSADLRKAINEAIQAVDDELRKVSLSIHSKPELAWEEHHAHGVLTEYMSRQSGFVVTQHAYDLPTAWTAVFTSPAAAHEGDRVPVVGFNSEMDALKGIGHACGHNLIAIAGCAAAIGVARTLERFQLAGKVVLIGTPAEEQGGGKAVLLDRGAYDEFEACLMLHPGTSGGGKHGAGNMTSSALVAMEVTYSGAPAHAGGAPEKGRNALDAAVLAYNGISTLRQQLPKDAKVHGVFSGEAKWSPNVIPEEAKLLYGVRSTTLTSLADVVPRVLRCFAGGALASNCSYSIKRGHLYHEVRPAKGLSDAFKDFVEAEYGDDYRFVERMETGASTDFGNVCFKCPSLHPMFFLPDATPEEHPHSSSYTKAAAEQSAHEATIRAASALSYAGLQVLIDPSLRKRMWAEWEDDMKVAQGDEALAVLDKVLPASAPGEGGKPGSFCAFDKCACGH